VQLAPAGLLAVVAVVLGFRRQRAAALLNVIVVATVAVAAYGIVAQYIGFREVFIVDTDAYPGFLTGTFVGRNAAATYFVIGIATATSWVMCRLETIVRASARQPGRILLQAADLVRTAGLFLFADLVLVVALLKTGSRGGLLACGLAMIVIAAITFY